MQRRWFLLTPLLAKVARADQRTDVLDVLTPMATALSEGDAPGFLMAIDKDMPDYGKLADAVTGLVGAADLTSSIEFLSAEGDTAKVDWYMQVSSKLQAGVAEQRHETVTVRLGRKKLLSIAPITFFRPLDAKAAQ